MSFEELLEKVLELEVYVAFVAVSVLLLISFLNREKLYSERARLKFKESSLKFKIATVLFFFSVYFYIIGELAILMLTLDIALPLNISHNLVHEAFEVFHLFLFLAGIAIGFNEVIKVIKDGV